MTQKCDTPPAGGASRNSLVGRFRDPLNPVSLQAQFLGRNFGIPSGTAETLSAHAFGGTSHE